jgi:hypothetical protein
MNVRENQNLTHASFMKMKWINVTYVIHHINIAIFTAAKHVILYCIYQ